MRSPLFLPLRLDLLFRLILFMAVTFATRAAETRNLTPAAIPEQLRTEFQLAPFYQKFVSIDGFPIVGSEKVSDAALAECAWIVSRMLERRPDIIKALAAAKIRFAVMAAGEYTTDIPEHAHLKPRVYWDRRARGLGATRSAPAVSGAEENLLAFRGDPYPREIICIHEFAHAIHGIALRAVDPAFDDRLRAAYDSAMRAGLWKGTYAASNRQEYWAEAVQAWFDNNDANNALHNDISTRAKLKTYDPAVASLCEEVFGDIPGRYQAPTARSPEDRAHLQGYDPSKAPRFRWRQEPVPEHPRIVLDCALGSIELDLSGPPERLSLLAAQIQEGYFSSGQLAVENQKLKLSPAEKTPDGGRIPEGHGRWTIQLGEAPPDVVAVKVTKGLYVIEAVQQDPAQTIRVQRIVRLN
jgi:hypothetical protein